MSQQIYIDTTDLCVCNVRGFVFFLLTVKISDLCHTIMTFSVLCSLLSDLCITVQGKFTHMSDERAWVFFSEQKKSNCLKKIANHVR